VEGAILSLPSSNDKQQPGQVNDSRVKEAAAWDVSAGMIKCPIAEERSTRSQGQSIWASARVRVRRIGSRSDRLRDKALYDKGW